VDHLRPGLPQELLGADVRDRADAGRRVVELAGVRLGVLDELGERVHRQVLVHDEHVRRLRGEGHGLETLDRIPLQVLEQRGIGRVVAGVGEQEGVPVRLGTRHLAGGDVAAGATLVVDDDLLAEFLGQALGEQARGEVRRPARRGGHHQRHGPARVVLLGGRGRPDRHEQDRRGEDDGHRGKHGAT
jgi:hypothetical protein